MSLLATALTALAGALLFERLRVPSGALIGAMTFVAILNLATTVDVPALPREARFVAYTALGWLIGQGVTRETVATLARSALPITIVVVALLAFAMGVGYLLSQLTPMDSATAYLAASPGALSQMAAIAASIGADASLVVTVHTLRVVTLILLAPLIGRLAATT